MESSLKKLAFNLSPLTSSICNIIVNWLPVLVDNPTCYICSCEDQVVYIWEENIVDIKWMLMEHTQCKNTSRQILFFTITRWIESLPLQIKIDFI
jgi:hypothetical protein